MTFEIVARLVERLGREFDAARFSHGERSRTTPIDPGDLFSESLEDRSHGVVADPIGQLEGIVALVE